jgi:MFS family permease
MPEQTTIQDANEKKVMNRWIVVIGAILIQLALGAIYAWSAFTPALKAPASEFGFTAQQTLWIFSAGLASFAIFTIIGGRVMAKIGPRYTALMGGLILGMGYILGGVAGDSFAVKLATIGVIGGAGIGLAYVVPIAVGVKWFPDKKGLVTGLAVAGFGFGAFIWILLANPPSVLVNELGMSGLIEKVTGGAYTYTIANVNSVFVTYGIIFLVLVVLGSLVMVNPPSGWKPAGWTDPAANQNSTGGKPAAKADYSPMEMIRTPQYVLLFMMFAIGALAGLMVIGNIQLFGTNVEEGFQSHGYTAVEALDYAVIGAAVCLPIFNGAGRIAWGKISDKIGRKKAFIGMFVFQGAMMAILFQTTSNPIFFYAVAALIGFNFGGNFALFPTATADTFGAKNLGLNYGFVFLSYGVGGIAGPWLCAFMQDNHYSFSYAFYPAAVLCFAAAGLAMMYKPEVKRKDDTATAEPTKA